MKGQFVDVIHTDAKHLIPNFGLGINESSGHLDFWPNNGNQEQLTLCFH